MFLAASIAVGSDLLLYRIAMAREVSAIRVAFRAAWKYTTIAQLLFVVGMIFGLIGAFLDQFNLFALWLIIAYGLLAAIIILRGAITAPWQQRVLQAANNSADLDELLANPNIRRAIWAYIVLLAIILYAMVLKPGGV